MEQKNLLGPDSSRCPTRALLDQLADKWAVLVLLAVAPGPIRFNALKREVEGITQKMLGQTLRRLEWNGIVARHAYETMPLTVEYELTRLGHTLMPVVEGLRSWSMANMDVIRHARVRYEGKRDAGASHEGGPPGPSFSSSRGGVAEAGTGALTRPAPADTGP